MDYTPMGLANGKYSHKSTYAHELALTVLFESGWVHFADDPDTYRKLPDAPKQFMKELPVAWDDTRFVAGYPGREAVLARCKGKTWFLAGVSGRNEQSHLDLNLKRILGSGQYQLTLISDGPDAQHFSTETKPLIASDALPVSMLRYGGFVATLIPKP